MIDKRTRYYKRTRKVLFQALLLITALLAITAPIAYIRLEPTVPVSPLATPQAALIKVVEASEEQSSGVSADELIDLNCSRFFDNPEYCKFQMHCLYWKESRNGQSSDHGDGGKAGGPMQFHQPTYFSMRHKMIVEGLELDTGSRYDLENAIETTAWALSKGEGHQWGPILRGECK